MIDPQLKAALREKLKEFGANYEWPYKLMRDNNRSPADQQQEAQTELLESFLVDLEQTLQPEIERLVVEAKAKAYQAALDHDRAVDSGKYLDGGKQFRTIWLEQQIAQLTQSNPQKGEL